MRLTKKIKEEIVAAVQRAVFKDKLEAFVVREHAVGDELYEAQFSKADLRRIEDLPDGWVNDRDYLFLKRDDKHGNHIDNLELPGDLCLELGLHRSAGYYSFSIELSKNRRIPKNLWCQDVVPNNAVKELSDRAGALRTASMNLREELEATLNACTTVAKLRQSWPDVDRFLPDAVLNPVKNLPVPVTDLEAALAKAENT